MGTKAKAKPAPLFIGWWWTPREWVEGWDTFTNDYEANRVPTRDHLFVDEWAATTLCGREPGDDVMDHSPARPLQLCGLCARVARARGLSVPGASAGED